MEDNTKSTLQECFDLGLFSQQTLVELTELFSKCGGPPIQRSADLLGKVGSHDLSRTCQNLGELLERKNKQYGAAFRTTAEILSILFPNGIPIHEYKNVLLITRVCDKLGRLASPHKNLEDESPWLDIAGYGVIGTTFWEEIVRHGQDSASS